MDGIGNNQTPNLVLTDTPNLVLTDTADEHNQDVEYALEQSDLTGQSTDANVLDHQDAVQHDAAQQDAFTSQQDVVRHIDANEIIQSQQPVYNSDQYTTTSKSQMNTFAIPKDTTLYHGSRNLETFDTTEITLSGDNYTAIFSEDITVAQGYTMNCNLVGPSFEGYVHRFSVINAIDNVLIVSPTDRKLDWSGDQITQNYCRVQDGNHYKAIGFIVNDRIQIAICNPRDHLKYEGTVRCVAPSTYSEEYQFTK